MAKKKQHWQDKLYADTAGKWSEGQFILFMIAATLLSIGAYFYISSPTRQQTSDDVVLTVRGKSIRRAEYDELKEKHKKFAEFSQNDELTKNLEKSALDFLILEATLEDEAQKRGISVTDAEINAAYQIQIDAYGSEEELLRQMKSSYDWTPELVKRAIKVDILKEKLREFLLNERDVFGVAVRWDRPYAPGATQSQNEAQKTQDTEDALAKINADFLPLMQNGATEDQLWAKLATVRRDPKWVDPFTALLTSTRLNEKTASDFFQGREDFDAIKQLNAVGQITPVTKSAGGYFAIYRLKRIAGGQFSDWEELIESVKKEGDTKINVTAYWLKENTRMALQDWNMAATSTTKFFARVFLPEAANADTFNCNNGHFSAIKGYTIDGVTKLPVVNHSIEFTRGTSGHGHPRCVTPDEATSGSDLSNTSGYFRIGVMDDPNQKALSCFQRWDIDFNRAGYIDEPYYQEHSVISNGITIWMDNYPYPNDTTQKYTGAYAAENQDNDGWIWVKPTTYTLTLSKTGTGAGSVTSAATPTSGQINPVSCGTTCGTDTGTYYYNTDVRLTATAAAGSYFVGWSGSGVACGSQRCVDMIANRSVTANFSKVNTLTVQDNNGGNTDAAVTGSQAGLGPWTTNQSDTLAATVNTNLTAPATVGAWKFSDWNSCDSHPDATGDRGRCHMDVTGGATDIAIAEYVQTTLNCASSTSSSVTLNYGYMLVDNLDLYRNGTKVTDLVSSANSTGSGSYTDSGLSPATTYNYELREYATSGYLSASTVACTTTGSIPPPPPPPPPSDAQLNVLADLNGTAQSGVNVITSAGCFTTYNSVCNDSNKTAQTAWYTLSSSTLNTTVTAPATIPGGGYFNGWYYSGTGNLCTNGTGPTIFSCAVSISTGQAGTLTASYVQAAVLIVNSSGASGVPISSDPTICFAPHQTTSGTTCGTTNWQTTRIGGSISTKLTAPNPFSDGSGSYAFTGWTSSPSVATCSGASVDCTVSVASGSGVVVTANYGAQFSMKVNAISQASGSLLPNCAIPFSEDSTIITGSTPGCSALKTHNTHLWTNGSAFPVITFTATSEFISFSGRTMKFIEWICSSAVATDCGAADNTARTIKASSSTALSNTTVTAVYQIITGGEFE